MSKMTTNKSMILYGAPLAWVHTVKGATIVERWKFDNLASAELNLILPSTAAAASGDNTDINRADGGVIRFTKRSVIVDGISELLIENVATSSDASKKGQMTLVINEAPIGMSMTAFLADIKAEMETLFMVTIATGFSYDSMNTQKKVDGWVTMLGKISADVKYSTSGTPVLITLTFDSFKSTNVATTNTVLAASTFASLVIKPAATTYTPTTLTAGNGTTLIAGDLVINSVAIYTYVE